MNRTVVLTFKEREALHGGAQALSLLAYDMEKRGIDKTEGLRSYATTLRLLASTEENEDAVHRGAK